MNTVRPVPVFIIDLAAPPKTRYLEMITCLRAQIQAAVPLFDSLLFDLSGLKSLAFGAKLASRLLLRRVFDKEQQEEIKAIAKIAGVSRHVIVALNSVLDTLMGCTSGAALTRTFIGLEEHLHMLHFRTLDWGMDQLRDLLVVLHYVDSKAEDPVRVIAKSITYAGHVGVLTGVRPGMSISLNFRPTHNCKTRALLKHQALVLLGQRESISSRLRRLLLDETIMPEADEASFLKLAEELAREPGTPSYVILCSPDHVASIEKDLDGGRVKWSDEYLVQGNHDLSHDSCCDYRKLRPIDTATQDQPQAPGRKREPYNSVSFRTENEVYIGRTLERESHMLAFWKEHITQWRPDFVRFAPERT